MTTTTPTRPALAGNRLVLIGATLYLLEWVAIVAAHLGVPLGAGAGTSSVLHAYLGHAQAFGWAAGWFSVVEMGRLLIMAGLAASLRQSLPDGTLMSVAVAAMAVSCALEIAAYGITASLAWTLPLGSVTIDRSLDAVAFYISLMVWGPFGVSMLCAGVAMMRTRLFGRVLPFLALIAGALATVLGLAFTRPAGQGAVGALGAATVVFWVWMIWTGVVVWRARPRDPTIQAQHAVPLDA
jgi:hypothetical protein